MKFGRLVGFVALLLGLYLLWYIRFILLLALSAVALATVLNRIVRQFAHWHLKRGVAIVITLAAIALLVAVILTIAIPPFINQVRQWLDQAPIDVARISAWLEKIDQRLPIEWSDQLQQLDMFIRDIPKIGSSIFSNFFLIFRGMLSFLINFLLVLAVTVMLLANPRAYRHGFVLLFPQFYRYRTQQILDRCEQSLVAWGIGIVFNMAIITVMSFIGLAAIGIPLPIGNAFIAGLLTFIPNVGPVLSVVPPGILALLESPWKAIAVIILYVVIQQVEGNLLTPLVMKRQVALLPAITLISQVICGFLFGFLGLFLALPLVVIGQVWVKELLIRDIMNVWYRQDPETHLGINTIHMPQILFPED
ncbi:MAG: AI-2E family transporter [Oscillatoriales cyanobacterium RM2_1_1]|nr:AI-2E family transporter [Oscillatoriales cyanobacterium SM2_3_0]NJO45079.1 AI-2E family transporter [Oscillatoriales cyanobacterium RM2_1_1]